MNNSLPECMDVDDYEEIASLASTAEEDLLSNEEWEVKDILAEGLVDGVTKYLIEWGNYPLHAASWEPREHLAGTTLADWEKRKQQDGHKRQANQRIRAWRKAVVDNVYNKMARHEERNRKRASRGLEQTVYEHSLEQYLEDLEGLPTGEDEGQDSHNTLGKQNAVASACYRDQLNNELESGYSPRSLASPTIARTNLHIGSGHQQPSSNATTGHAPCAQSTHLAKTTLGPKFSANKPKKPSLEPIQTRPIIHRTTQETNNVFVGGKTRKKRPNLLDAATDPTKQPRILKLRLTNKLAKGFRDREGVIAPAKKPNLFYLDPERERIGAQAADSTSTPNPTTGHPQEVPQSAVSSHYPDVNLLSPKTATDEDPTAAIPKKKKKKTVCFLDEPETIEPDPDTSLFIQDQFFASQRGREFIQPKEENNEESESLFGLPKSFSSSPRPVGHIKGSPISNGTITKHAKFSPDATSLTLLTFHGLPREIAPNLVARIEGEQALVFTHICMAKDFWQQYGSFSGGFFRGRLTSNEHSDALQNVANRLKLGSFGILCRTEGLCILVYSTNCVDWAPLNQTADGETLSFIIFDAGTSMENSDLAPLPCFIDPGNEDLPPGMRPAIIRRVLGFEYNRLLPTTLQETTQHSFFLAFPPTHGQEAIFLAQWLRSCNAECKIQTSLHTGHWFNFLNRDRGVVIIHEDAAWAIRLFPGVSKLLESKPKRFGFWLFSKSLKAQPLLRQWDDSTSLPGDIRLQPIFAVGVAILITPSFLLSQPQQAYTFAKWIWKAQKRDVDPYQRARFVVCAGIEDWLHELAVEKIDKSASRRSSPDILSNEAIEASFKTWQIIRKLVVDGNEDGSNQLIFAPDSIDGNDEQSLVNWFGWWSIMNMDQFRKFIVLGSGDGRPKRLIRRFKAPNFSRSTIGNPDEVYRQLDVKEQAGQSSLSSAHGSESQSGPRSWSGSLRVVSSDQSNSLISYMDKLLDAVLATKWCPLVLYKFPVSYWNPDMDFHFRDYKSEFSTYTKCFHWFNPFREYSPQLNTMTALFYTIEGHWDPKAYPQGITPRRRPWILMHRPINLHRRPWSASELLIWDLTKSDRFIRDQNVYEDDLIEAQREAIRIFQKENHIKNPDQPITRVMIAGFDASWMDYANQIDATLMYLTKFTQEPKYWLPIPEVALLGRGWKRVKPGQPPPSSRRGPSIDAMDIDEPEKVGEDINTLNTRTVFHPPRGKGGSSTKCHNRLYQCTKDYLWKSGMGVEIYIEYTFRPTLEWYREQLAEGRGFEHIKVMPWQSLFEHYGIPDPKGV